MRQQQKLSLVYAVFIATGQSFSSLYSYWVYVFLSCCENRSTHFNVLNSAFAENFFWLNLEPAHYINLTDW